MSDIPNTEYITINKDGIFVGGKPATIYRGEKIVDVDNVKNNFVNIQKNYPQIAELHVGAFATSGKFTKPGNPSGKFGLNEWCRVKLQDGRVGSWVFYRTYSSASLCAYYCARDCGIYVRIDSDLRSVLLSFAKQYETINIIESRNYRITIEKLKEHTK